MPKKFNTRLFEQKITQLDNLFVSKLFLQLHLFFSDIRKETKINGQSINLAMSNRGLKALQNAGIDTARLLEITVPMRGRMIHKDGKGLRQKPMLYDVKYERVN